MRRPRFINVTLALLLLVFIAACGGAATDPTPTPQPPATDPSTPPALVEGINGRLLDSAGQGVAAASVSVFADSQAAVTAQQTDAEGYFRVEGLAPGSYSVVALKNDVGAYEPDVKVAKGEKAKKDLTAKALGAVSGKVTVTGRDSPLGVSVFVPGTSFAARADDAGSFLMTGVPEGTYRLVAYDAGLEPAEIPDVSVKAGETTDITARPLSLVAANPEVEELGNSLVVPGDVLIVRGKRFGKVRGTSFVNVGGVRATEYPSWSETELQVTVPFGAANGPVIVSVGSVEAASTQTLRVVTNVEIVSGSGQTGVVQTKLKDPLVVRVSDSEGKPAEGIEVTFAVQTGDALDATAVTNAEGLASTEFTLGSRVEAVDVLAELNGRSDFSGNSAFTLQANPASVRILGKSGKRVFYEFGSELNLEVAAHDAAGEPIPDTVFELTSSNSEIVIAPGPNSRVGDSCEAPSLCVVGSGKVEVTATAGTLTSSPLGLDVYWVQGLAVVSGEGQSALPGTKLSKPFVFEVLDTAARPVEGVNVSFATDKGQLDFTTAKTGADGRASTTLTLGEDYGVYTVTASLTDAPERFSALVEAEARPTEVWSVELTGPHPDVRLSIAGERLLVGGSTDGSLPGNTSKGERDAFYGVYQTGTGANVKLKQYGTEVGDQGLGVVGLDDGGVLTLYQPLHSDFPGPRLGRFDAAGNELFSKTIPFSSASGMVMSSGAVYIIGSEYSSTTNASTIYVSRYDADGNEVWRKPIEENSQGGTAYRLTLASGPNAGVYAAEFKGNSSYVAKFDSDGNEAWRKELTTDRTLEVRTIGSDASGSVYAMGNLSGTLAGSTGNGPTFVIKLNSADGSQIWAKRFDFAAAPNYGYLTDFTVTPAGAAYLLLGGQGTGLTKLSADGAIVFSTSYKDELQSSPTTLVVDASGGVYVASSIFRYSEYDEPIPGVRFFKLQDLTP